MEAGARRAYAGVAGDRLPLQLLAAMILPFALDFRADTSGGGALVQGALLVVHLAAFAVFLRRYVRMLPPTPGLGPLVFACTFFIVEAAVVALLRGQPAYSVMVNTVPVFLYISTAYATAATLRLSPSPFVFARLLAWLCLAFLLGRVAIIALMDGIDPATVRYEILSGAAIAALGLAPVAVLARMTRVEAALLILNLGIVLASVTRTLLVAGAAQLLALLPSILPLARSRFGRRRVLALACLPLVVVVIDLTAGTGFSERWLHRLLVASQLGIDPTSLTRIAEVDFMKSALTASAGTLLFGNGLAAETSRIGPAALLAGLTLGWHHVEVHAIGFGHHNHWSLLFIGGLVAGLPLLLVQFHQGAGALLFLARHPRQATRTREQLRKLGLWGATIIIGTLAYGFFAAPLGDRGTALWYGIGTGLTLGAHQLLRANAARTVSVQDGAGQPSAT